MKPKKFKEKKLIYKQYSRDSSPISCCTDCQTWGAKISLIAQCDVGLLLTLHHGCLLPFTSHAETS
jgi:hypothetical protein